MDNYQKLFDIIAEIPQLIDNTVTSSTPEFQAWKSKTTRFLLKIYGSDSYEYKEFEGISFSLKVYFTGMPDSAFVDACKSGLQKAEAILRTYLEDFEKDIGDVEKIPAKEVNSTMTNRVFIVHGHNEALKEAVARLIEKQSLQAIILHEQANQGATIIEKFENYSDVGAAICLFTADDIGRAKEENTDNTRARQNVIFEAGYFIGKLGRKNVILISDKGVEIPSDLKGVVYTDTNSWKFSVLQELKAMGFNIDYNKLDI